MLLYVFCSLQGFPGDLGRSLGKDTTLSDVLQTLDKHYCVVMTFSTLSKELYSLKQGLEENVAEFGGGSVTAGPDTPVSIPRKDPARTHGGNEV